MIRIGLCLLIVGLVACSDPPPPSPPSNGEVSESMPERLGEDIRNIRQQEEDNIIHQMPNEVTTRILTPGDSTYYETTYMSDAATFSVYATELTVWPPSVKKGLELHERFARRYSVQFGDADTVEKALQWVNPLEEIPVEIALFDQGLYSSKPYLKLTFYQVAP